VGPAGAFARIVSLDDVPIAGGLVVGGEPAIAGGAHLGRSEQPAPKFVEPVAKAVSTLFDALPVDHASAIVIFAGDGNPQTVSHSVTRPQIAIRL
jgi:hypothetical protein